MTPTLDSAWTFLVSAAIGLLVGIERERNPSAKAGLRTFALIAVFGTLCAALDQALGSSWLLATGLAGIGAVLAGSYLVDPRSRSEDSGTTTVVAALVVFLLGALNFHGQRALAVALGIGMTALLHFKTELEGAATRLTAAEVRSILQFSAVSAVVLPLLPDQGYGPYAVLNPFHIWLMVVIVSGVSLAGYLAWRLTVRHGLVVAGLLGGLVSSTATTLVYARHARDGIETPVAARMVILLANSAMLLRVLLIATLLAPPAASWAALAIVPALLLALPTIWRGVRRSGAPPERGAADLRNPTQLGAALLFAAGYALVLLAAAWLADVLGTRGVLALAFFSGLTDVDAIMLSSLRLAQQGRLAVTAAAAAIVVAVGANLIFKAGLALAVGRAALGRDTLRAFAGPLIGLGGGLAVLLALA